MKDIAVVGAGIVGLATAYAARQRGAAVTVYDPAEPGSGQSAGQSRLFRHAHDDARMVELAIHSRAIWQEWEQEFGVELISSGGALLLGPTVEAHLARLEGFGEAPARLIGKEEVVAALPLLAPTTGPAMLDKTGGTIRTRSVFAALGTRLADALVRERVLALRPTDAGRVEVRTSTGLVEHDRVIVCAGTGSAAIAAGLGLQIPVRTATLVRVGFGIREKAAPHLATLQDGSTTFGATAAYGAPYPHNTGYSVGLAADVDMSSADGPAELAALTERTIDYVRAALPGLDPTPTGFVHCQSTELPWHADGCAVWESGPVSVIVGHNLFKHAPALAQHLAEHVLGAPLPAVLTPPARFGAPLQD